MKMNKKWGVVGCGWLGTELAKSLLESGHEVIGSTSTPNKIKFLQERGIKAHLLTAEDFHKKLDWMKELDVLVLNVPPSSFGESYADSMVGIATQIKESCNVIFVSSTSVYPNNNSTVDESSSINGEQRNGPVVSDAEKALENLLREKLTILRMSGLVGGERHPIRYMTGREIKGARQPINLVHRDDCVGIIQKVVNQKFWGQKLNVCSSKHPTKEAYYKKAAVELNLKPPIFIENESNWKIVSNLASREKLGYEYIYDDPFDFPL